MRRRRGARGSFPRACSTRVGSTHGPPHSKKGQVGAHENKQTARDAYAAFSKGDADGAMRSIDDSITYNGDGMLVAFDTLGDEAVPNRVFARS